MLFFCAYFSFAAILAIYIGGLRQFFAIILDFISKVGYDMDIFDEFFTLLPMVEAANWKGVNRMKKNEVAEQKSRGPFSVISALLGAAAVATTIAYFIWRVYNDHQYHEKWKDYNDCGI